MYFFSFLNDEVFRARSTQQHSSGKRLASPGSSSVTARPAQHSPAPSPQALVGALQQLISIGVGHPDSRHQGKMSKPGRYFPSLFIARMSICFSPSFLSRVTPYPKSGEDTRMEHSELIAGLWSAPSRVHLFLHRDNPGLDCFVSLCAGTELLSHVCFPVWVEIISEPLPARS